MRLNSFHLVMIFVAHDVMKIEGGITTRVDVFMIQKWEVFSWVYLDKSKIIILLSLSKTIVTQVMGSL